MAKKIDIQCEIGEIIQVPLTFSHPNFLPLTGQWIGEGVYSKLCAKLGKITPGSVFVLSSSNMSIATNVDSPNSIYYGDGLFVVMRSSSSLAYILKSSDGGMTWTPVTVNAGQFVTGCWTGANINLHVIAYASGCMTAPSGANSWTTRTMGAAAPRGIAANSSTIVISDGAAGVVYTSTDGITWTQRTAQKYGGPIAWNGSVFCSLYYAASSLTDAQTSSDGITWTGRTGSMIANWTKLVWSSYYNLFIAVGLYASPSGSIMTSPDGITWTTRTIDGSVSGFHSVALSGNLVLVTTYVGTTSFIYTSTDLTSWTRVLFPDYLSVQNAGAASDGNGTFVLQSASSSYGLLYTSLTDQAGKRYLAAPQPSPYGYKLMVRAK